MEIRQARSVKELRLASLVNRILTALQLPCRVVFAGSDIHVEARHVRLKKGGCYIIMNPFASITVPEHIIFHEAAHHGQKIGEETHGPEWAGRLRSFYVKTGFPLPASTMFESFAELCKLKIRGRL